MFTELSPQYKDSREGKIASEVIGRCVHCGFCNATCPTYQLLGDELDGPRGRIYQMKQVFEGAAPTAELALHLDRCLTCRNCETTCPSGVEYHRLLDVGREVVEPHISRNTFERIQRWLLRQLLSRRYLVTPMMRAGQLVRGVMPAVIKNSIPARQAVGEIPRGIHTRKILLLDGCVQPGMKPATNAAAARVLGRLGIQALCEPKEGCCGALSFHLNAQDEAKGQMRRNIDAWWPHVEQGVEAIVSTASGCGVMVKDYAEVLADDPDYADKAKSIADLTRDLVEVLDAEDLELLAIDRQTIIAFHPPCTLQHGQKLGGRVEAILSRCGFNLTTVPEAHLCCGSAGTYSIFQKTISRQLRDNKLTALHSGSPELIATANIGCQLHLEAATALPVVHWIELLDETLFTAG